MTVIRDNINGAHILNGNLNVVGYVHFVYMTFALTELVLFYFNSTVSRGEALAVSILLYLHLAAGMLQPSYYVHGRVGKFNLVSALVAAGLIIVGYLWLTR